MSTGIDVDGLAEFRRTTAAAVHDLEQLDDAHRAAGELLINQPQPRTPAVASDVRYDLDDGLTLISGEVIYAGHNPDVDLTDQLVDLFQQQVEHIVSTIHGT